MRVTSLPTPSPSPSAYLIVIHASATNFFDLLQIQGKYQHQVSISLVISNISLSDQRQPPLPFISGAEFAGIIIAEPTNPPTTGRQLLFHYYHRVQLML